MANKDIYTDEFKQKIKVIVKRAMDDQLEDKAERDLFEEWAGEDPQNDQLFSSLKDPAKIKELTDLMEQGYPKRQLEMFRQRRPTKRSIFTKGKFWYPAAAASLVLGLLILNAIQTSRMDVLANYSRETNNVYMTQDGIPGHVVYEHVVTADFSEDVNNSGADQKIKAEDIQVANTGIIATKTIVVPTGKEFNVVLPDGSKVWLGANSTLTFPESFSNSAREVSYTGEAYFDVVSIIGKPFIVKAGDFQTKVFGTEFYMLSGAETGTTTVSLLSGSVEVSGKGGNSVMLSPGQKALSQPNHPGITVEEFNIDNLRAVRDGMFVFWGEKIKDILPLLNNWFDYKLECNDDQLADMVFYLKINKNSPVSEVVRMLSETNLIEYRINNLNKTIKLTIRD